MPSRPNILTFPMFLHTLWRILIRVLFGHRSGHHERPLISLLIPFSSEDPIRRRNFHWLKQYWQKELPDAEIIVGHSHSPIFCKGEALNDAASRSRGRVLVIMDADAYMDGQTLEHCAKRILEALECGHRMWFVPYRYLYRLKQWISLSILASDPYHPLRVPDPPPIDFYDNQGDRKHYGHRYGAMCMMFPREAYAAIGCFDERMAGWGGEDISLLRCLDTVWGKHKTINGPIFHIWHPNIGEDTTVRMWEGQVAPNANGKLTKEYHQASRKPSRMKELIERAIAYRLNKNK